MYFYLILTVITFISVIYAYNYGRRILSHEYNQPSTAQQADLEDSIDEFFDYQTNEYCILNNISLPSYNSSPILIDTLLISTSGIYIIQLSNVQGEIRYSKDKHFEKVADGDFKKLFISSQIDKTLLSKLECYLPNIDSSHVNYAIMFNHNSVFSSIMPDHVYTPEKLIESLHENSKVLSIQDMIVPIGMLVSSKNEVKSDEMTHKKSA